MQTKPIKVWLMTIDPKFVRVNAGICAHNMETEGRDCKDLSYCSACKFFKLREVSEYNDSHALLMEAKTET